MRVSRSLKVWKMGTVNYLEALKLQDKLVSDRKTRHDSQGMRISQNLKVWKMGTVNYLEALKLQDKLVSDKKTHKISDTILSLQHPPTYTLGKQRTDHNLLVPEPDLKNIGAELHYTQRGGDITFYGPHQAILYPIISLWDIGLARAGQTGETGVWVGNRKIGAIGVRISSRITSHGLAFNIDPNLSYFKHIVPCGIANKDVTSLRRETDKVLPAEDVINEQLISCFARITKVLNEYEKGLAGITKPTLAAALMVGNVRVTLSLGTSGASITATIHLCFSRRSVLLENREATSSRREKD
ncbi:unnamed protein product [Camellia sinensis]